MSIRSARKGTWTRRSFAAGAAFLLFAVLFAAPLYAAMSLCSMPCCHHETPASGKVSSGEMGCGTECAVRSDDATTPQVASLTPDNTHRVLAPAATQPVSISDAPRIQPSGSDDGPPARSNAAPLHVLNSVFRI